MTRRAGGERVRDTPVPGQVRASQADRRRPKISGFWSVPVLLCVSACHTVSELKMGQGMGKWPADFPIA